MHTYVNTCLIIRAAQSSGTAVLIRPWRQNLSILLRILGGLGYRSKSYISLAVATHSDSICARVIIQAHKGPKVQLSMTHSAGSSDGVVDTTFRSKSCCNFRKSVNCATSPRIS